MKLNTKPIDDILNKFLEPYDITVFAGTDWAYYYISQRIEYAFVSMSVMDEYYHRFVKELGFKGNADLFIISLLHELGHSQTEDDLTQEEIELSIMMKENCDSDTYEHCLEYFNAPDELAATTWAVEFMNEHSDIVSKLWAELQPAILDFYKTYDIH